MWLAATAIVFSFMSGIVHTYYAVLLAPAVAALVGAGVVELWRLRERSWVGGVLFGGAVLATSAWAWVLLERTPTFAPGLGTLILVVGTVGAVALAIPAAPSRRRLAQAAVVAVIAAMLAGPAAYAADTMGTALSGGDPAAGPEVAGSFGRPGDGGPLGADGAPVGGGAPGGLADGQRSGDGGLRPPSGVGPSGGPGGEATDAALLDYLVANRGDATWLVAVSGSGSAAPIQLATGIPVMAMGGFSGGDDAPTIEAFRAYVASGELRFVLIGGSRGGGPGGFGGSGQVTSWVTANCAAVDVGSGTAGTLYDCAATGGV
jgi:4-amino-4-deoxy-L-arabinose transferase-like glycosyltransferase